MRSSSEAEERRVTDLLRVAVAELLEAPLTGLSNDAVVCALREVEQASRMLAAVGHRLIVEASDRSLPSHSGTGTVKRFLMQTLRLSSADAAARVGAATSLGTWHDMGGEPVEPHLPATAAAQADGDISVDHARGIAAVMKRVPGSTRDAEFRAAEEILADFARTGSPDDIPKVGEAILARLDPDGHLTDERDRQRMRGISIGRQRADGMSPIRGELTPTLRALLDPVVAKLGRPGMNNPEDPDSPCGDYEFVDNDRLAAAARRDTRTTAQRTHDAVLALLRPGVSPDALGRHRGLPVSTILTMSVADVEKAAGVATTATGGTVPLPEALKLAERSQPFLMVFNHDGVPLHLGKTKRLATADQRMALIAAVRGCSRPGCDAPASLCAIHHVTEWGKGGPTDIGNETLACDRCHALVHNGPGGWKTVVLGPDSKYPGRTGWIAPPHLDPSQTPTVNHRHHPGEFLAEALARIHTHTNLEHHRHLRRLHRLEQPMSAHPEVVAERGGTAVAASTARSCTGPPRTGATLGR
ncbi:DUF222 domain-containing protein [Nocardia sp. NPDC050710]|uniref:HNH endonuclease signature motif containing protein n=1 Tax=Nocardia sp. NPDC050710 TaxID=3157220 RepID=UPI0033F8081D